MQQFLRFVFRDQKMSRFPAAARAASLSSARICSGELIEDALRRIEAKTIEMKFLDPVARVAEKKLPHRSGIRRRRN